MLGGEIAKLKGEVHAPGGIIRVLAMAVASGFRNSGETT